MLTGQDIAAPLLALLPAAAYVCAAPTGTILLYNDVAATLWGRMPSLDAGIRYCGALRLLDADGRLIPPDETPMARLVRGEPTVARLAAIVERPDGSQVPVTITVSPLTAPDGRQMGAIGILHTAGD
ncbi:MAG: PAS domain-containing protein, partial [Candidatus Sericytochromatia bacterium]|nr:PAS domain-containing protein [Candidatus Sericytochromatia bacterium]